MAATTVVASAYDTSGNGGRKLVRLSNGWLISCAYDNGNTQIKFYKSTDNGVNWSQICYTNAGGPSYAIASNGTMVYCINSQSGGSAVYSHKFDATTQTNTNLGAFTVDSGQTSLGSGASLCIDGNGYLHAAWSSKNATYPNSFNIRYSKSTDGGSTWAAVTQITTTNTSGSDWVRPCIAVKSNNYPIITCDFSSSSSPYIIKSIVWNGTTWNAPVNIINSGISYPLTNGSMAIDSNDNIHVVWSGTDSTDTSHSNIRYAKSTDGGTTWVKADGTAGHNKLTSGDTYYQQYPSITIDKNNNLYILWRGQTVSSPAQYQIRKIEYKSSAWSSIVDLTSTSDNNNPQTLWSKFNMNSDDAVRWIYMDSTSVKYDSIALLWSHKLMGVSTPSKIMGITPSKVMGVQ